MKCWALSNREWISRNESLPSIRSAERRSRFSSNSTNCSENWKLKSPQASETRAKSCWTTSIRKSWKRCGSRATPCWTVSTSGSGGLRGICSLNSLVSRTQDSASCCIRTLSRARQSIQAHTAWEKESKMRTHTALVIHSPSESWISGKDLPAGSRVVAFELTNSGKNIAVLSPLRGKSGWLSCSRVTLSGA